MDARKICEIKVGIELIVSSSPCNLTIEQLNKKYYRVKREKIPYKQLGHKSLESFLRSMPTTLRLGGTGSTAVVINAINCLSECGKDFVKLENNKNDHENIAKAVADNCNMVNDVPHNGANLLGMPMPKGYQQQIDMQIPSQYSNPMLLKEANRMTDNCVKQTASKNYKRLSELNYNLEQIVKNMPRNSQDSSASADQKSTSQTASPLTNFTESVVHLGMEIATGELPERGSIFPLSINSIKTPHEFYFSIYSKRNELKLLKYNMNNFYGNLREDQYKIPLQCIMPELYCAVFIYGDWLRAQIIEPMDRCNVIKVKAIDIEIIIMVKYTNAKLLLRRFAKSPAQALCGSLSFLRPINGCIWSAGARKCFKQLASERELYGQVTATDPVKKITNLILWDAKNGGTKDINTMLILLGMAKLPPHIQTS